MKKPTISDVAQKAGVSISTVSRVMNGNSMVDEALRVQVELAAKELSYLPNRYAQAMRRGAQFRKKSERIISVILPTVADNFFSHVLEQMSESADEHGVRIVLLSCHGDSEKEIACIESAFAARADGLLYCPSAETGADKLFDFFPRDFPIVVFYRRSIVSGVPHIFHDNEQGGYLAAKYLLHQGRKNIAFFGSFWHNFDGMSINKILPPRHERRGIYSALDRFAGYVRALTEYGVEVREELLFSVAGFGFEAGKKSAKEFLSRMCDFDAVFCGNDEVAAGVIAALQEQQYSIPEAVSVIGYDDLSYATATRPMLTTIRQDPAALGRGAVEMICALMDGKKVDDRCVEASLVIRDSTAVKQ